jgi:hypothetical protein
MSEKRTTRGRWIQDNLSDDLANLLFKIRVELPNDNVIEKDIKPDVMIDYDMLEEQLAETPAIFAFWSSIFSELKLEVARLNQQLIRRQAKIYDAVKKESQKHDTKFAKYELEEIVELDDKILDLRNKVMVAERNVSKVYAIIESIKMKSEHLRSLAGFKKQEMRDTRDA